MKKQTAFLDFEVDFLFKKIIAKAFVIGLWPVKYYSTEE